MLQEIAEAAVHLLVNLARSKPAMLIALIAFIGVGVWVASR
jgi:hypothetical protein